MTVETRPVVVPVREKSVADVLRHAARIIEERGWTQLEGSRSHPASDSRVCLVGSVEVAGGSDAILYGNWFARWFGRYAGSPIPMAWNDTPGRTAAEVIAALRAAADAWEADR